MKKFSSLIFSFIVLAFGFFDSPTLIGQTVVIKSLEEEGANKKTLSSAPSLPDLPEFDNPDLPPLKNFDSGEFVQKIQSQYEILSDLQRSGVIDNPENIARLVEFEANRLAFEKILAKNRDDQVRLNVEQARAYQLAIRSLDVTEPIEFDPILIDKQIQLNQQRLRQFDQQFGVDGVQKPSAMQDQARAVAEFYNGLAGYSLQKGDVSTAATSVSAATCALDIALEVVSFTLDVLPVVGNIKAIIEVVTGYNLVTADELSTFERSLALVSILPLGSIVKGAKVAVGGFVKTARDFVKTSDGAVLASGLSRSLGGDLSEAAFKNIEDVDPASDLIVSNVERALNSSESAIRSYSPQAMKELTSKLGNRVELNQIMRAAKVADNLVSPEAAGRWLSKTDPIVSVKVMDDLSARVARSRAVDQLASATTDATAYLDHAAEISQSLMHQNVATKLMLPITDPRLIRAIENGEDFSTAMLRGLDASSEISNVRSLMARTRPERMTLASDQQALTGELLARMSPGSSLGFVEISFKALRASDFILRPGTSAADDLLIEMSDEVVLRALQQSSKNELSLRSLSRLSDGQLRFDFHASSADFAQSSADELNEAINLQKLALSSRELQDSAKKLDIDVLEFAKRRDLAIRFYSRHPQLKNEPLKIEQQIEGIDFGSAVEVVTIKKGESLIQYQALAVAEDGALSLGPKGNYFTDLGESPLRLGLDAHTRSGNFLMPRVAVTYKASRDTQMLKSRAANIYDYWSRDYPAFPNFEWDLPKVIDDAVEPAEDLVKKFDSIKKVYDELVGEFHGGLISDQGLAQLRSLRSELVEMSKELPIAKGHYQLGGGVQYFGDSSAFEPVF